MHPKWGIMRQDVWPAVRIQRTIRTQPSISTIPSHKNGAANYCCTVAYIRTVVDSIDGLETGEVSYCASVYRPYLIVTWMGLEPGLPSILLNSHADVVQADPATWSYDPFCAFMDKNGDIFGRGSQDTKDVGMMYLEAIRNLKIQNFVPTRTIHVTFTPDEEIAGSDGFQAFAKSSDFTDLNVGNALDEGGTSPGDNFTLYNRDNLAMERS